MLHLFLLQILDRVEKFEQERAATPTAPPPPSEHDLEINYFSEYLKVQMKKIPTQQWMDFTMESMMLAKKFVYGEEAIPPRPRASPSPPINVVDEKDDVVPPSQVTTMNVVPSSTSHNLSSYLASLGTPAIPQPLYGDFLSPRMALMGSPSLQQHMMRADHHAPQNDKIN